jgi:hypothetical protein
MFLAKIFEKAPESKIYLEFQNLDWILRKFQWNSVSHEHVNYFTLNDFKFRYELLESGNFSGGEWSYVLIIKSEKNYEFNKTIDYQNSFKLLYEMRGLHIQKLSTIDKPILIYGGAGKGIIFSHAIASNGGPSLYCLDSDKNKHGKYLECSGVLVLNPHQISVKFKKHALMIVMNENHVNYAKKLFLNNYKIISLANLSFLNIN